MGSEKLFKLISLILVALVAGAAGGYFAALSMPKKEEVRVERYEVVNITGSLDEVVNRAYQRVSPSVVHITSTVLKRGFFFEVIPQRGTGSGILVSSDGYVLTNNHVIENADQIEVTLSNGERYEAELVGSDPANDIAVIRLLNPPDNLPVAPLGDSSKLRIGEFVIAIGNPFGLDRTATLGIISSLNRSIRSGKGYVMHGLIQTDASINPGNSGGPLVNLQGEVIGINTAILTTSGGSIGIGFAIPINRAREIMQRMIEEDREIERRPWLGISGVTVTEELARVLNLPVKEGAMVVEVVPGSPADRAGLRAGEVQIIYRGYILTIGGDIIVEIDGEKVDSMERLVDIISRKKVGQEIEITFVRGGELMKTRAKLGGRK
ncbi:MAG: trypsin-like serine protease [Euryarchaeota archaeon]|nr:trypsin-like serine protease [Euryarchaeota archaeon]